MFFIVKSVIPFIFKFVNVESMETGPLPCLTFTLGITIGSKDGIFNCGMPETISTLLNVKLFNILKKEGQY